ncbi:hypothetical protein OIV83_001553 [Microbotryomycetes sp. JL201]|nr:hypothetical protein OIV83_001553 [Microbotryomycetes sp. JL201]
MDVTALDRFVNNPAFHDVLGIVKGARNGLVYGAKVRFPHALVMTLLFHSGSFRKRAEFVFKATKQHAFNLAKFVSIYKTALLFQKNLAGGKQRSADTFFAGLIGGWFVFGDRNPVNEQIVLYVVSRVITSFLPRATPPAPPSASSTARPSASGVPPPPGAPYPKSRPPHPKVFSVYAAVTWGLVMYLFRERRDTLHGGMVNSMQYLYLDSEVWNGVKTLLWPGGKLPWAKSKRAAEEDSGAAGTSVGNMLSQVTSPQPDLSSLKALQPKNVSRTAIGKPRAFTPEALALFKTTGLPPLIAEEFKASSRPATVVRQATIDIQTVLDSGKAGSSQEQRLFLTGAAGSGKSVVLLQAVAYAQASDWIVLYLPSATPYVNSSTAHVYSSSLALFEQPAAAVQLVSRIANVNKAAFKKLKASKTHSFGDSTLKEGTTLDVLCSKVSDKTSTAVLTALLNELAAQNTIPVLLAVDDAQGLFATSKYVDPSYQPVEAYQLAIPRLLLEFASGTQNFNTGAVVFADSVLSPTKSTAVRRFLGDSRPQSSSPYTERASSFEVYSQALSGVRKQQVPARLSRTEAAGLMELIGGWRGNREAVSDALFLERYVATDGNPRLLRRSVQQSVQL